MNAWQKRNEPSHNDNGADRYAYSSNLSKDVPDFGSSRNLPAALSPRLGVRLKTLGGLLYVVGAIAMLLFIHGGWFELSDEDTRALDRVVIAGGVLVWSVWFFPWHRFVRNLLLIPMAAALALIPSPCTSPAAGRARSRSSTSS